MDREKLYEIHQENLELLENELGQVKKMTQINLGRLCYEKENASIPEQIRKLEYDVLGGTRLYTFLLCSWLETRLKKILYENSSAAFTEIERNIIFSRRQMSEKWRACLNMAVCKSYGFAFDVNRMDYFSDFSDLFDADYYRQVCLYLDDIKQAITVRNKLAHGQWKIPLNNSGTSLAGTVVNDFFCANGNIQKLDLLYNTYKIIAEVISAYVVYKDKITTDNFRIDLERKLQKIHNYKQRMEKANFDNYCNSFYRRECIEREGKKKLYKK